MRPFLAYSLRDRPAADRYADTELSDRARAPGWVDTFPGQHDLPFGEQLRRADAVRAASANGRDEGYRHGYIAGFGWGAWCGAIATASLIGLAYGVRAWLGF